MKRKSLRFEVEDAYELYQLSKNLELETTPYYKVWKQLEAQYDDYKKARIYGPRLEEYGR